MWKLYAVATTFPSRSPSQIVGIEGDWGAYCFDAAVRAFGMYIEGKLRETNRWGRPRHSLESLLGEPPQVKQFADPRALLKYKKR